jgi:hypothetical protein
MENIPAVNFNNYNFVRFPAWYDASKTLMENGFTFSVQGDTYGYDRAVNVSFETYAKAYEAEILLNNVFGKLLEVNRDGSTLYVSDELEAFKIDPLAVLKEFFEACNLAARADSKEALRNALRNVHPKLELLGVKVDLWEFTDGD